MPTIDDQLRQAGEHWRNHIDHQSEADTDRKSASATDRARPSGKQGKSRRQGILIAAASLAIVVPAAAFAITQHTDHASDSPGVGVEAQCAAPRLQLAAPGNRPLHVGQQITITGFGYLDGCQDGQQPPQTPHPIKVTIKLVSKAGTSILITAQATGDTGSFRVTTRVPADASPGPATLASGTTGERTLTVTIGPPL